MKEITGGTSVRMEIWGFLLDVSFEKTIELLSGEGSIWWHTDSIPQGVWSSGERLGLEIRIWVRSKQCSMSCCCRILEKALLIKR